MTNSKPSIKKKNESNLQKNAIDKFSRELSKLSYEKSIEELDDLLNNLQDENLLVEELQINYIKANLYIEHCENLLDKVEQEIIEIKSQDLESLANE